MFNRWLNDRMKLNMVRSIVALIRKVKGNPIQVANMAEGSLTSARKAPDGSLYQRAPEGVSIFTTNEGVDYELKSPNLQAADVQHDGRNILLAIASGVGMAEYAVTSDASNANYASTMVAEAPMTREFYDWQDFFADLFKEMFERIIQWGIDTGRIPGKEKVTVTDPKTGVETEEIIETETECEIVWPELVHRDIEKETKAYMLQKQAGWLSDRTASVRLDLDPEEEREQIRKEEERNEADGDFNEDEPDDKQFNKVRDAATAEEEPPEK